MILANIPIAYLINSRFGAKRKLITSYIHDISNLKNGLKEELTHYNSKMLLSNDLAALPMQPSSVISISKPEDKLLK